MPSEDVQLTVDAPDGARLAYWVRRRGGGPAPALLLVHGAASNHTRWSEFVRRTGLGAGYDLVRPDMRGNAQSMFRGRLDLDTWCRDLVAILDAEGQGSAVVVGHSLGAQIALHLAAAFPRRVRAVALIDPVVRPALLGRLRRTRRLEPLLRLAVGALRVLNRLGLRRRRFPGLDLEALDAETRAAMRGAHPQRALVRRYSALGPIFRYMPVANYLQQALATIAPLPNLRSIDAPTLVLESTGAGYQDRRRARAELTRLPRVSYVEIDATHWPLTERPDEVREAIERWVERGIGQTFGQTFGQASGQAEPGRTGPG